MIAGLRELPRLTGTNNPLADLGDSPHPRLADHGAPAGTTAAAR